MANLLRYDPTRMTTVRRRMSTEVIRRLNSITRWAVDFLRDPITVKQWEGMTHSGRIFDFNKHLQAFMRRMKEDRWYEEILGKTYLMSSLNAFDQVKFKGIISSPENQVMRRQFLQRITEEKVNPWNSLSFALNAQGSPRVPPKDSWGRFMSQKAYDLSNRLAKGWKREADYVSESIAKTVVKSIADGKSPWQVSKDIQKLSNGIPANRADAIAFTEITRASAQAQLDSFEQLGIKEVSGIPEVEIETADDEFVCDECNSLVGQTYSIEEARDIIPVHPYCRCAWKAVEDGMMITED